MHLLMLLLACGTIATAYNFAGLHLNDRPSIGSGFDPAPFAPFGAPRSLLTDSPYRGLPMPPLAFPFPYPTLPSLPFFPPPPVPPPYGYGPFGGPSPFGIQPPLPYPPFPFYYPPPLPPPPPLPAGPPPAPIIVPAKTAAALSVASLIHALIARKFYPPVLPFPVPNPIPLPVPIKIPVPVDRPISYPQPPLSHHYPLRSYPEDEQLFKEQVPVHHYNSHHYQHDHHSTSDSFGQQADFSEMILELRPPPEEQNELPSSQTYSEDTHFNEVAHKEPTT